MGERTENNKMMAFSTQHIHTHKMKSETKKFGSYICRRSYHFDRFDQSLGVQCKQLESIRIFRFSIAFRC